MCVCVCVENVGYDAHALGGLIHADDHSVREMCRFFLLRPNGVQVFACCNSARICLGGIAVIIMMT